MRNFFSIVSIIIILPHLLSSCILKNGTGMKNLTTTPFVDLSRYVGQWYEIARYPNRFQKNCVGSKANYSLTDDGKIKVINECYDNSFSGKLRTAKGKAWVVDNETNAKLKVSFFWPFSGDYWIIDLGQEYEYAVIGHPDRKYLWILSRSPDMDDKVYQSILAMLQEQEYDTEKLIRETKKQGEEPL